jgi:ABC-type glycerol-3-phosphate transport system substrate-binding protein
MNSSHFSGLRCDHPDPTFHVPPEYGSQSKGVHAKRAYPGKAEPHRRLARISLLLASTFLLVTGRWLSAGLAENAPAPDAKASLVLFDFGAANDKQIRNAAIARFNKRYPNVKVTEQFSPISTWSDYLNKLITEIALGKAPDLIHLGQIMADAVKPEEALKAAHEELSAEMQQAAEGQ